MAAGKAIRFGSVKQLLVVGPNNEILADYAIKEVQKLKFSKVVIITRDELLDAFTTHFKEQNHTISIEYVCQDKFIPEQKINGDIRFYGTGMALLSAKPNLTEDFIIINGDDYYGEGVFPEMANSLGHYSKYNIFLAGYKLKNTLSPNGAVSRAVCKLNQENELIDLNEHTQIIKEGDQILSLESGEVLLPDTPVSMNCWGFRPDFFETVVTEFEDYIYQMPHWEHREFSLPDIVKRHLIKFPLSAKLIPVNSKWVGLTYSEDKNIVTEFLKV